MRPASSAGANTHSSDVNVSAVEQTRTASNFRISGHPRNYLAAALLTHRSQEVSGGGCSGCSGGVCRGSAVVISSEVLCWSRIGPQEKPWFQGVDYGQTTAGHLQKMRLAD